MHKKVRKRDIEETRRKQVFGQQNTRHSNATIQYFST